MAAPVLSVKAYKIDAYGQLAGVSLQQTGNLQHYAHATGAIIGCHHRLGVVGLVWVVVSPGTTVPVGTEQDALLFFWLIACNDIIALKGGAVETFKCGSLFGHVHAVTLELLNNPLSTLFVSLTVHGARTEVALLLTEGISGVGRELRSYGLFCF